MDIKGLFPGRVRTAKVVRGTSLHIFWRSDRWRNLAKAVAVVVRRKYGKPEVY